MLRISATAQTCSKTVGGASCPAFNIFAVIALCFYMSQNKNTLAPPYLVVAVKNSADLVCCINSKVHYSNCYFSITIFRVVE